MAPEVAAALPGLCARVEAALASLWSERRADV
jgi:hypothetical protein